MRRIINFIFLFVIGVSFLWADLPDIGQKTAGMNKYPGFFSFYWDAGTGKVWLEIDKFDTEFLYVSSLSAGIGSNDLVQYTLAVDRGNSRIAYLYDALHPSIIRLIYETVQAAHSNNIWAGLCGEMTASAGVHGTLLLIGSGLDELSAPSFLIPEVKKIIRSVTFDETKTLLKKALNKATAEEIREMIDKYLDEKRPELKE